MHNLIFLKFGLDSGFHCAHGTLTQKEQESTQHLLFVADHAEDDTKMWGRLRHLHAIDE